MHHLFEQELGAADAGAYGVERQAGLVGDVLVGEVVEQAQLGYPAVAVGQGGDGADEEVVGLVVDHMVLGRDFGLVAFYGGFVGLAELDGGEGAAAADVVYGGVAGDGEEPGPEEVFRVEAADALVGLSQAFLADVLGVCGVGADALDVEAQLSGVAGGQGGEGLCVSGHGLEGQAVVIEVSAGTVFLCRCISVPGVFDVFCHICKCYLSNSF